ncbi:MAG: DUF2029 domain-containing protein [Rhodopseudomonas sp.]|uniref:glycosyltransferase family 87 protein n=1 Tax=Rhodopseudomonas sp. TaxID=1078 RepID=UPI00179BE042|nr:glycosyltransferase family 87 protein [Rhodopseudomonas sp.]NVN87486.1 DUF2029 domain-containing protein [Rhodopseudomonas sp.]
MERSFSPRLRQLHWYEVAIIAVIALIFAAYLPIVVKRTVVHGFGDVQVFFRAGWAIWTGYPLYQVADNHGWTYHYPPTFALLMGLFANPLEGMARPAWALSFSMSVAVWYVIGAVAMALAVDLWARALQRCVARPLLQDRWNGWWLLRLGPLLALLPFFGDGLGRGQPTALVLLSMVAFLVLYVRGRIFAAACCLAIGFTIKIFPLALLLIPLLRRDWKTIFGTAGFGLVFLIAVPALCLGTTAVVQLYTALWTDHLSGILGGAPNPKIAAEITFTSYDMLSIGAMLARIGAGGLPDAASLPPWATAGQIAADAVLLGAVLIVGHGRFWRLRGPQPEPSEPLLIAGAILCAALPVMLSVSQPNYVAFAAPLLAVIQLDAWRRSGRVALLPALFAWSAMAWFGMIATEVEVWQPLRVIGLTTPAIVILLGWGLACLRRAPVQA